MNAEQFIEKLAEKGGKIVSTNDLTFVEIAAARDEERLYVNEFGYGFVYLPPVSNVISFPNK